MLFALVAASAGAQTTANNPPGVARVVRGQVRRPTVGPQSRPLPVPGQWVVLHRVGSDRAGPLDSMRTNARGSYVFRYTTSGSPEALYFVSSRYRGIAYFSPPLREDSVSGGDGDILVYDTTPDTTLLHMQGRHFVVSAPRAGSNRRDVVEIFDVVNGGAQTVVARDSTSPIWSTQLPVEAESASVAPGDIALGAVVMKSGRADVFAPFAPGARQLVLTYTLPASAFPWSMPIERAASVVEVLLEEPTATAEGARLVPTASASIEGRTFRRYLAQDVPANAVVRISVPGPVTSLRAIVQWFVALMLAAMIVALGAWRIKRKNAAAAARLANARVPRVDPDTLVAEIATLDARFERVATPSVEERAAYEQRRAALKTRLERVLAEAGGPP